LGATGVKAVRKYVGEIDPRRAMLVQKFVRFEDNHIKVNFV